MSRAVTSRVVRAEEALMVGADYQKLLSAMRFRYNLDMGIAVYEVILVKILSLVGGFEPPRWVVEAFDKPLPVDLTPRELGNLRRRAGALVRFDAKCSKTTERAVAHLDRDIKDCLAQLSQYTGESFQTLGDVGAWCAGPGRDYEPVGVLAEAIARWKRRDVSTRQDNGSPGQGG